MKTKQVVFEESLDHLFKFRLLRTRFFLHLNSDLVSIFFLLLIWIIGVNLVVHLTVNLLLFHQISESFNVVFCPLRFFCAVDFKTL